MGIDFPGGRGGGPTDPVWGVAIKPPDYTTRFFTEELAVTADIFSLWDLRALRGKFLFVARPHRASWLDGCFHVF